MRSILSAHGIHAIVGAELAGLGGASLSNDLWVADEDKEEAAALLRDLREHGAEPAGGPEPDEAAEPDDDREADADARATFQHQLDRRRRTGIALLLGFCLTFGTAHLFTRAWLRGIALAGIQTVGFLRLYAGDPSGRALIVAAIAADLIGALWRIRATRRPALPTARVLHG